jgi:hypothetical protein
VRPRVLVGCEFSGVVRDAFARRGFDAWSCDLEPSETEGNHVIDDVLNVVHRGRWDLFIAHPPCTDLAASGAWAFKFKGDRQEFALALVRELLAVPVPRIAIENPVSVISTRIAKPTQVVQPWWFGHPEPKATCLWLKALPKLRATNPVIPGKSNILAMPPSAERRAERSRTYRGVAEAMAEQWGAVLRL